MAHRPADSASRIAVLAVRALEALYVAVCGEPPAGARAWRDGSTLLLVLKPAQAGAAGLDCETVPVLIAEAVRSRTGAALQDGRWRSEPSLGIEMFVFRLPSPAQAQTLRVPSWQRWSPLPTGEIAPAGRR
jgi:hypothetical protein